MQETVTIINKLGLHARAAAKFVKTAQQFEAQITVTRADEAEDAVDSAVVGTSILGLMMLAAEPGTNLIITSEGKDAEAAIEALKALVANKFGEGE